MLSKLRNLKKSDRLLLFAFLVLVIAVVVSGINYKPNTQIPLKQQLANLAQNNSNSNDDDTSNLGVPTSSGKVPTTISEAANAQCHLVGELPDPSCTPGAIDPSVTQANISSTICVSGYTKTVRPPTSYTSRLKVQQIQQYGFIDTTTSHYEEDHLISLELGGSPSDVKNLWPEPGASPNPKDEVENKLHQLVCSGTITLAAAQSRIATNWTTATTGY